MKADLQSHIELHIAVILFGFTAILGALISISALSLVWWRVLIASALFLPFMKWSAICQIPRKILIQYSAIGCIASLHWILFYGSIKVSNSSIALVCLSTTAVFTSIIEPLIVRKSFSWRELFIGLLVVPPMILAFQGIELDGIYSGICLGLLSAFFASLFAVCNKKLVGETDALYITFIELVASSVFVGLTLIVVHEWFYPIDWIPVKKDWLFLMVMSLVCTNIAFLLAIRSLKHLSAFSSNLVINLEPIYGILLAFLILKEYEKLNFTFYLGSVLILISILTHTLCEKKYNR